MTQKIQLSQSINGTINGNITITNNILISNGGFAIDAIGDRPILKGNTIEFTFDSITIN